MSVVPDMLEVEQFHLLLKRIDSDLKFLMKNKPLIRKEWDTRDFSQEVALKYFKNLIKIAHTLKSDDHRLHLLRKMAKQIINDKLRNIQRVKRDVRKKSDTTIDLVDKKAKDSLENLIIKEDLNHIKSKISKDVWKVLEWRSQGKSWEECSDEIGATSTSALRLKVRRYVDSVKN